MGAKCKKKDPCTVIEGRELQTFEINPDPSNTACIIIISCFWRLNPWNLFLLIVLISDRLHSDGIVKNALRN